MNKKVFVSMLGLTIIFLAGLYIAKIFFPQEFVMAIENERLVKIGNFIDSHKWLYYICCGITSFATYYLYCCACCGATKLRWCHCGLIAFTVIISILFSTFNTNLYTALSYSSFVFLPTIFRGKLRNIGIAYSVHLANQSLSLSIRDFSLYFTNNFTFLTGFLMTVEMYFWLLLLYVVFNHTNEKEN